MSAWAEYVAAGLLHSITAENVWTPEKLAQRFQESYKIDVDVDIIIAAARIISSCDLGFADSDPFAGTFIKIRRSRIGDFIRNVNRERDPSFTVSVRDHSDIFSSQIKPAKYVQVRHTPNLDTYNSYPILRRYFEFGDDFIVGALQKISRDGFEGIVVPASDRIVSKSDNQEAYEHSVEALDNLQSALATGNEAGDIFGDDRDVVAQEVSTLASLVKQARVRAEPVIALARKCLGWIAEKAGSAAIGDLAKRALSSLMDWLFP
ncbi:hypothetical protein [Sphingomonas koreensis]